MTTESKLSTANLHELRVHFSSQRVLGYEKMYDAAAEAVEELIALRETAPKTIDVEFHGELIEIPLNDKNTAALLEVIDSSTQVNLIRDLAKKLAEAINPLEF